MKTMVMKKKKTQVEKDLILELLIMLVCEWKNWNGLEMKRRYMVQINIIRMFRQFEYFEEYQRRVGRIIGDERTKQLVKGALFLITVGGNDFVNNYYLVPFSARSRQYDLPDYVNLLIVEYRKLLLVISTLFISFYYY